MITHLTGLKVSPDPGSADAPIMRVVSGTVTVDPPSIAATTRGTATATIAGVAVGDLVEVYPPTTLEAGLIYCGCAVTGANTVTIYLYNTTAAAIDGAALSWRFVWVDLTP